MEIAASEEETKEQAIGSKDMKLNKSLFKLLSDPLFQFVPELGRVAFKDPFVTIYPVIALSTNEHDSPICSYVGVPASQSGRLDPKACTDLGCNPRLHFKLLKDGKSVTLDNGTVVTPEMVCEKSDPSESFMIVFLPSEHYIQSFIQDN